MVTASKVQSRDQIMDHVLHATKDAMCDLSVRWEDERGYESFGEYIKVLKKAYNAIPGVEFQFADENFRVLWSYNGDMFCSFFKGNYLNCRLAS